MFYSQPNCHSPVKAVLRQFRLLKITKYITHSLLAKRIQEIIQTNQGMNQLNKENREAMS